MNDILWVIADAECVPKRFNLFSMAQEQYQIMLQEHA
jgi:hypothetical protein